MAKQAIVQHSVRVGVQVGKGILVHARGNPSKVVAVAAAAGVVTVAVAISYATVLGARKLFGGGS